MKHTQPAAKCYSLEALVLEDLIVGLQYEQVVVGLFLHLQEIRIVELEPFRRPGLSTFRTGAFRGVLCRLFFVGSRSA